MYALKKAFCHSPWHYVAAVILSVVVMLFRRANLRAEVGIGFALYDSCSVAGGVTFLIGALLAVAYFGAFDLFGYVFGRAMEKEHYKSYAHYASAKEEKRGRQQYYFVPYFVVGALVFLISLLVDRSIV